MGGPPRVRQTTGPLDTCLTAAQSEWPGLPTVQVRGDGAAGMRRSVRGSIAGVRPARAPTHVLGGPRMKRLHEMKRQAYNL